MQPTEAQIRRMVTAALSCSEGYRNSGEQIDWRALCAEQNKAMTRGVVYRKALFGIIAAQAVVIAGLVWRAWK